MSLTNFPHGITSFGIPVFGSGTPATFGNVFFIDYRYGSDDNIGDERDSAFKTLTEANSNVTTNANDVVLIDGDSEIAETAMVTITKNRSHYIGLNGPPSIMGFGAGARVTQTTTGVASDIATIHNTGVRNTFTGIKFSNGSTTATSLYTFAEGGEYTRFNFCEFYKGALLTTAGTAEFLLNGDSDIFYGCTFGDLVNERGSDAIRRPNILVSRETITGKVARDCALVDCLFQHKAAHVDVSFIWGAGATDIERRLLLVNPIFWNCVLATADPADAIDFGGAQTNGDVLLVNPAGINITAFGGASLNIYVQGAVPTAATTGISVEVAA